ncbi:MULTISPECIES: hypothetical protein [unclassified Psychrobacter]|uniref:hypothetical protein n=1 Tax=unclassified Psychrobacter TaxID=196806 RepID=UPI003F46FCF0
MEDNSKNDKRNELEKTQNVSFIDSISDKNTWIKGLNITKENIPFILIIISGMGAAIQTIELSKIDLTYLRFFSVSQLAADGALVTLTVLASYIMYRFYLTTLMAMPLIGDLEKAVKNKDKEYTPENAIPVLIFSYSVSTAALFMHSGPFKDALLVMIAISSMMLAGLAFSLKYLWLFNKQSRVLEPVEITPFKVFREILMIATPATMLIYTVLNLGNIYLNLYKIPTPERLANYEYVESRIEEDYGKDQEYKIRYFNDKYTFIEITEDRSIAIYKTDDVLFNAQHIIIESN